MLKYFLSAVVAVTSLCTSPVSSAEPSTINMVGDQRYVVPLSYRPVKNDTDGIGILVSFPDFGPLIGDKPGWQDNAQILVIKTGGTIAQVWDKNWDGTPAYGATGWNRIEKKYRLEPEFTVQEMGSEFDIIVPDQDLNTFPLGVFRCWRPTKMPFPSCSYLFDLEGQRWEITVGRQFIADYRQIRKRAIALVNSFKEK